MTAQSQQAPASEEQAPPLAREEQAQPQVHEYQEHPQQAEPSAPIALPKTRNNEITVTEEAVRDAEEDHSGTASATATPPHAPIPPRAVWRHAALYGTITATLSFLALPIVPSILAQHPSHDPTPFFIVGFIFLIIGILLAMSMIFAFPATTRGEFLDKPLKVAHPARLRGLFRAMWSRCEQGVAKTMALFLWGVTSLFVSGLMFAIAGIYTPDLMTARPE